MDIIKWNLGSTAVRITEEYIYNQQQVCNICSSVTHLNLSLSGVILKFLHL